MRTVFYQTVTAPPSTSPEAPHLDSFAQPTNQPPRSLKPVPLPVVQGALLASFGEQAQADKFAQPTNQPRQDLKRQQWTYPSTSTQDTAAETSPAEITLDQWFTQWTGWEPRRDRMPNLLYREKLLTGAFEIETSPEDGWVAEIRQPRFDLKRLQHLYPSAFDTYQSLVPPPVLADRWLQNTEQPRWELKRMREYPQAVQDSRAMTVPETVAGDKSAQPTNQYRWDLKRLQYYYPSWMAPDNLTSAEAPQTDKFAQPTNQPRWDLKRWQWLYPSVPLQDPFAMTLLETVTADRFAQPTNQPYPYKKEYPRVGWFVQDPFAMTVPEQASIDRISQPYTPYPYRKEIARLGWLTQDASAMTVPEVVLTDRWFRPTEQPRQDIRRWQYLYRNDFFDPFPLTAVVVPPMDTWAHNYPDYIYRLPYTLQHEKYMIGSAQTIWPQLDNIYQPSTVYIPRKQQWLYPSGTADPAPVGAAASVPVDRWGQPWDIPRQDLKRLQYLYSSFSIDATATTETTQLDKWFMPASEPRRDLKRLQYYYRDWFMDPNPIGTVVPVADTWLPGTNPPRMDLKRLQWLYPSFFVDTKVLTQPEVTAVDKWFMPASQPRQDLRRQQWTYRDFFMDPNVIIIAPAAPMDWLGTRPDYIFRSPNWMFREKTPIGAAQIDLPLPDKYFEMTNAPVMDFKRWQRFYPSFTTDPSLVSEIVNMDKWFRPASEPRWDLKRNQHLYPSALIDPGALVIVPVPGIDGWGQPANQPQMRARDYRWALYAPTSADIQEPQDQTKWEPLTNQRVIPIADRRWVYPATWDDVKNLTQPEGLHLDGFVQPTNQPRMDLKRWQWLLYTPSVQDAAGLAPMVIYPDSWHPVTNQPQMDLKRLQRLYPSWIIDWKQFSQGAPSLVDAWMPHIPQPFGAVRRSRADWYTADLVPPAPFISDWRFQSSHMPMPPVRYPVRVGWFAIDSRALTQKETVTVDKWAQPTNQPQMRQKDNRWAWMPSFTDPTFAWAIIFPGGQTCLHVTDSVVTALMAGDAVVTQMQTADGLVTVLIIADSPC